ncbi:MAG: hypothetical protein M1833_002423 [Piccolia ochrophora]|nr:MAG: hypothetical protein M1833_002423 [Piccolia ochrophora]
MACAECFTGTLHSGTPAGREATVHGLPTYIASPPSGVSPKGLVIILSDAFGWSLVNTRILADAYAKKGNFLVYLPDVMGGHALSPRMFQLFHELTADGTWWAALWKPLAALQALSLFLPWLFSARASVTKPRMLAFCRALRAGSVLPLGVAGFCWGGRYAFHLGTEEGPEGRDGLVDAVFIAHPSLVSLPGDVAGVRCPVSVAVGDKDHQMPPPKIEVLREVLSKKAEVEHEVVVYEGATHGFAVRESPDVEKERQQGLEAEDQAVNWFTKWLAS